jgi:hypothetical protein
MMSSKGVIHEVSGFSRGALLLVTPVAPHHFVVHRRR